MSQPECLFCHLYAEGDHVRKDGGFAAIRDINPKAPVHLLVIPERHVDRRGSDAVARGPGERAAADAEQHRYRAADVLVGGHEIEEAVPVDVSRRHRRRIGPDRVVLTGAEGSGGGLQEN